tara:strand:+ start:1184 stop:3952 length:2769 start_codon:yes stop_codon:yes gene_type:complete
MGATYTRQSTYSDGDTITASDTNDEFDQLVAAFAANTGHTHDGTAGEGGPITALATNTITFGTGSDTDIAITFDANTNDGVLTWKEDEDYFEFSDDVLLSSTEKIQFGDTASFIQQSSDGVLRIDGEATIDLNASTAVTISNDLKLDSDSAVLGFGADNDVTLTHVADTALLLNDAIKLTFRDSALSVSSSTDGQLDIDADTEVEITTPLLEISADATVGDDLTLKSDAAVLGFGADTDVTLTHVADTALLLNSSRQLQFGDSGTYIHQSADGVLDLVSDTEIEINATTIDMNGAAELSGNLTLGAQLRMPDNTASKLLIADGTSYEEKAVGDLSEISTVANDDVFLAVDTSGGGLKKITRSTIVSGLATSSGLSNVVEDTTPQLGGSLDVNGEDIVSVSNGNITLTPNGSGVVRIDGSNGIDMQSGAISIKNAGSESYVRFYCEVSNNHYTQLQAAPHASYSGNVTVVLPASADTLVGRATTDTLTNKTLTSPVINTGTFGTSILPVSADGTTLGSASKEFSDLFLADGGTIQFGNDQEITLTHVADSGLTLKHASTSDDKFPTLTLAAGDNDIAADDKLGVLNFIAPDEGAGTDAILVAAGIEAVSEGDFSASSNATKLSFKTASSAAAAETMSLSSAGLLTVADDIVFKDGGTIGVASATDAMTVSSAGIVTFKDDILIKDGGTIGVASTADAMTVSSAGIVTFKDDIIIKDAGTIGSASDTDALAIASDGVVNFTQQPTVSSAAVKVAGKETIWIPAAAMYPETTNGCASLAQVELSNGPELKCLDFDKSSDEHAQFTIAFPKSWNEGTITFQAFFTATSTDTGTTAWGLSGVSLSDNGDLNTAFGTTVVATAKAHSGTSNDLNVAAESGNVTIAGSPAAGDLCIFQVLRDVSADDLDADARLLGIKLFFTTDAANDA